MSWVLFQYPIKHSIIRSREVSKPRDWSLELSDRSEFWQIGNSAAYTDTSHISKQCDNYWSQATSSHGWLQSHTHFSTSLSDHQWFPKSIRRTDTARCRSNAVNFLQNHHKRHPLTLGRAMWCLSCVQTVIIFYISHRSDVCPRVCATSWYIGPRYNGTRLYYQMADKKILRHFVCYESIVKTSLVYEAPNHSHVLFLST